ncbi:Dienelactone hydrolase family protein [hydrothermal vent metagenome]|uniref:Dienelactone hydrolase family protein n=1 Tax=hydrothermal vent metagenome TaxID=652676 RepID=A0A3B0Y0W9_9ZZZZ
MKRLFALLSCLLLSFNATAAIKTETITYKVDTQAYTGFVAWDDSSTDKRPGVLVVHEWWGHNDYARKRAVQLAEAGYVALALDMYGEGKVAEHPDDAKKFMQAVLAEKGAARKRFEAAHELLAARAETDPDRIAAMGYCFGGGVVLNMARAGVDLDGVVSFHGSLGTDSPAAPGRIKARVLVFTGAADPFAPPEQVTAFEAEMKAAGASYTLTSYPGVKHSFTNPDADRLGKAYNMPLEYNADADKDSWEKMLAFFREIFSRGAK